MWHFPPLSNRLYSFINRAKLQNCEARPKAKFEDECRGLFGICMLPKDKSLENSNPSDIDFYEGKRMQPYDYTGCRVVGGKAWGKACKAKFLHICELPTFGKNGIWINGGATSWKNNPFKCRYGNTWEAELRKSMRSSKVVWVNDLVAHTIAEGNRLYAGTRWANSWVVYHDALSVWWDPGAQALMRKLGMADRQVRARGPTAAPELTKVEIFPD